MILSRSASVRSVTSQRRTELTCAVCQEVYKTPKILPCFHSFCQACLERLAAIHGLCFPCPSCRKPTRIPPGGVGWFQTNFYIPDSELERARRGVDATICPLHALHEEPLAFLCVQCDQPICIRCKLTKHENHETEDLTEAVDRCKSLLRQAQPRLDDAVQHLQKSLSKAQRNRKEAQAKSDHVKEQIRAQCDVLIAVVTQKRDAALEEVDEVSYAFQRKLPWEESHAQYDLNEMKELRGRLNHAVHSSADVEVLEMEREMREGKGAPEKLSKVQQKEPNTTDRVGLMCEPGLLNVDDILKFIGRPIKLTTANVTTREVITNVFRCGKDGSGREVHAVCASNNGQLHAAYGGTPPEYSDEQTVSFNCVNGDAGVPQPYVGRLTYRQCNWNLVVKLSVKTDTTSDVRYNAKSTSSLCVQYLAETGRCEVGLHSFKAKPFLPFHRMFPIICSLNYKMPLAFDVRSDKETFVVVQAAHKTEGLYTPHMLGPKNKTTTAEIRKGQDTSSAVEVNIFRSGQCDPVATYSPPQADLPFWPTDVCFWRPSLHEKEKLLVADYANDCIHVVSVTQGQCRFERFLAAGSGDLVKPTALNTNDARTTLWIGCANGWVLKCEALVALG